MKKQTKLVAVLSTAALLAIGASMTSFAATGWAEEDGTWVYYDRNGDKVTDKWAKSGNNWYYLDNNGEMAVDTLIEDGDNYYYVDINGVRVAQLTAQRANCALTIVGSVRGFKGDVVTFNNSNFGGSISVYAYK